MANVPMEAWAAFAMVATYFLVLYIPTLKDHKAMLVLGLAVIISIISAIAGIDKRSVALLFTAIMGSGTLNGTLKDITKK